MQTKDKESQEKGTRDLNKIEEVKSTRRSLGENEIRFYFIKIGKFLELKGQASYEKEISVSGGPELESRKDRMSERGR